MGLSSLVAVPFAGFGFSYSGNFTFTACNYQLFISLVATKQSSILCLPLVAYSVV